MDAKPVLDKDSRTIAPHFSSQLSNPKLVQLVWQSGAWGTTVISICFSFYFGDFPPAPVDCCHPLLSSLVVIPHHHHQRPHSLSFILPHVHPPTIIILATLLPVLVKTLLEILFFWKTHSNSFSLLSFLIFLLHPLSSSLVIIPCFYPLSSSSEASFHCCHHPPPTPSLPLCCLHWLKHGLEIDIF